MEENNNVITLVDLVSLFRKKFKLLVVIGLLVAIVSGVCGGFLAVRGAVYKAEIEFSISPSAKYEPFLYYLRSGRFAEQMLLQENGLPPKDQCNAADYDAALVALQQLAAIRDQRIEKSREINRFYTADIENRYKLLTDEYNEIYGLLKMYKEAQADALVTPAHEEKIAYYEEKLEEADAAQKAYFESEYSPAMERKLQMSLEMPRLNDRMADQRRATDAAVEKVLAAWREDKDVAKRISHLMKYVTYEYRILEEDTEKDSEEEITPNGYVVKIEIPTSAALEGYANGEEYAQDIVDRFEARLSACVCNYLEERQYAYEGKCTVTNPVISIEREPESILVSAAKYAVLFAVLGAILAYVFFVLQMALNAGSDQHPAVSEGKKKSATEGEKK